MECNVHAFLTMNLRFEVFMDICTALDIHKPRTSPYHPSGNGMVEVLSKTRLNMISVYVNDYQQDWDIYFPILTSAYRSCADDIIGLSPDYAWTRGSSADITSIWVSLDQIIAQSLLWSM